MLLFENSTSRSPFSSKIDTKCEGTKIRNVAKIVAAIAVNVIAKHDNHDNAKPTWARFSAIKSVKGKK